MWVKIKPLGDHTFWSMLPLTRVPFWVPIFDSQSSSLLAVSAIRAESVCAKDVLFRRRVLALHDASLLDGIRAPVAPWRRGSLLILKW